MLAEATSKPTTFSCQRHDKGAYDEFQLLGGRNFRFVDIALSGFIFQAGQIHNDQAIDAIGEIRIDIEGQKTDTTGFTYFSVL